MIILKLY